MLTVNDAEDSSELCSICGRALVSMPLLSHVQRPCTVCSAILWTIDRIFCFERHFQCGRLTANGKFLNRETGMKHDLTEVCMALEVDFDLVLPDNGVSDVNDLQELVSCMSRRINGD